MTKLPYRQAHRAEIAAAQRKYGAQHRAEIREKAASPKARANKKTWNMRRRYGVTIEVFNTMWEAQAGLCAICLLSMDLEGGRAGPHLDHDHETGRVRGLLCGRCNRALGLFRDNIDTMRRAIAYVSLSSRPTA